MEGLENPVYEGDDNFDNDFDDPVYEGDDNDFDDPEYEGDDNFDNDFDDARPLFMKNMNAEIDDKTIQLSTLRGKEKKNKYIRSWN